MLPYYLVIATATYNKYDELRMHYSAITYVTHYFSNVLLIKSNLSLHGTSKCSYYPQHCYIVSE